MANLSSDPENNSGDLQVNEGNLLEREPSDYQDLFGDADENVRVELYRISPVLYEGHEISGFLDLLEPSMDLSYISKRWGGGRYNVKKRKAGRFVDIRAFRIAGDPRVLPPPRMSGSDEAPALSEDEKSGSIGIGGTDEAFFKRLERIKMIKLAFPEPLDINTELLRLAINNKSGPADTEGMFRLFDNFLAIAGKLRSEGGGEKGSTVYDLVGKGIDAFTKYVDAAKTIPRPALKPLPVKNELLQIPNLEQSGKMQENIQENQQLNTEENIEMSQQEISAQAIHLIVESYLIEPPLSISETVDVLQNTLHLREENRPKIIPFRNTLKNMARLHLNEYEDVEPEKVEKFPLFFEAVFDIYTGNNQTKGEDYGSTDQNQS
ncbi:MAG: hypothetical protein NTV06_06250 [candidate division Zixibacteria bacterium]|nr:hypothetical protein [candidate division Zixibacteria bacterium]